MENKTSGKRQLPAFVILGIIALVAALVLALTNAITKGPIAEHALKALRESFSAVMPADEYTEINVSEDYGVRSLYEAKSGGKVIGWCVTAAGMGYNGEVAVTLGVGPDGLVTGCAVGDTSFAETPGFGARSKEKGFQDQFIGLDAVNGGAFEALSGATITSEAVRTAVNKALACVDAVALKKEPAASPLVVFGKPANKPVEEAPAEEAPLTGDVRKGSAKGFMSDVQVEVALDASGVVTGLTVESSSETPGFGTRCAEDADFKAQFIGKSGPFAIGEGIDALAGATVTSKAVVEAINNALAAPAPTRQTGSAKGFMSDVQVEVVLDANGTVTGLTVESSSETPGFGTRCAEDADFKAQFIGKSGPFAIGEGIDALAGATVTSKAVVEAINNALAASAAAMDSVTVLTANEQAELGLNASGAAVVQPTADYNGVITVSLTAENGKIVDGALVEQAAQDVPETPAVEETPVAPAVDEAPAAEELVGTATGYDGKVTVKVTLDAEGKIATLKVEAPDETPGLGKECEKEDFTKQFIGKTAPFSMNIDAVTSATITSQAVLNALNTILPSDAAQGTELTATAQGFAGDVTVNVTMGKKGKIAALTVSAPNETAGFGKECEKEDFTRQFIGQKGPFCLGLDAVASATITSQAVATALNDLLLAPAEEEAPAVEELVGTATGYDGKVTVKVTLDAEGKIATLKVEAPDETPGLGKECEKEDFTKQFIGKTAPFSMNIDAVTSATITSQAVLNALNTILPSDAAQGTELTATAQGFAGDVTVNVTMGKKGKIAALTVSAPNETAGFGKECEKEDFTKQFVGQKGPFCLGLDAVTSATITSQAVATALNNLLLAPVEKEAPAVAELTGKATGFEGTVTATLTLDAEGKIATLKVEAPDETPGFGKECEKEDFTKQFIGKSGPFSLNIDAVTSATITSQAVVNALNTILPTDAAKDAELTATAQGYDGPVTVTVTMGEKGEIATLKVSAPDETPGLGKECEKEDFTKQFVGKSGPFCLGIDAVASATITSQAVVDAINSALSAK